MNAILVRIADTIGNVWASEPIVITGLVGAVLELLIAFGVQIDQAQKTAIMAFVAAVGLLIARSQVTPPANLSTTAVPTLTATFGAATK